MRSHSYWPQNYSRVVFGCHVGGSDVISFSRTISPAKTTKTKNPRDGFGGKWQTSSRKKNTTCLRCSSFWCALLYKTICRKVWISTRTQSWFWTLLLCFEWCGILVWFSTLLLAFFTRRRKRRAGKAPNSRNKENRGAEEAKEIYFLRDFPLNLKGNFSASKERNKHFRHYRTQHHHRTHNIIYKNGIRDEVTNQRRFQKSRTGEENGHSGEEGTFLNAHRSRGVGFVRNPSASSSSRFRRKKREKKSKKEGKNTTDIFSSTRDE